MKKVNVILTIILLLTGYSQSVIIFCKPKKWSLKLKVLAQGMPLSFSRKLIWYTTNRKSQYMNIQ
jgi:hypothetical protein